MTEQVDGEHRVLSPGARSGLKREFAFALGAQAELSPMGRTRSGKTRRLSPPGEVSRSVGRRGRRARRCGSEESLDLGGGGVVNFRDSPHRGSGAVAEVAKPWPLDRRCDRLAVNCGDEGGSFCGGLDEAADVDGGNELVEAVNPIDFREGLGRDQTVMGNAVVTSEQSGVVGSDRSELVETVVPIDCRYGEVVESFSGGRDEAVPENVVHEENDAADGGDWNGAGEVKVEIEVDVDCRGDSEVVVDESKGVKVGSASNVDCGSVRKVESVVSGEGNKVKVDCVVAVEKTVGSDDRGVLIESKKPVRRFTRSLLKSMESSVEDSPVVSVKDQVVSVKDQFLTETATETKEGKGEEINPVKPVRRFTRSLLKGMEESGTAFEGSGGLVQGSGGLVQVGRGKANTDNVVTGSAGTPPTKKMELKMSKKIELTKVPTNVRELLATGVLDGMVVQYAFADKKKKGVLCGVINNGGILCSCSLCEGVKTISAFQFEVHAGSNKKHPANFISLENGASLYDIIQACARAPIDMLELTIKNAAGLNAKYQASTCQECKAHFQASGIGNSSSICDACLVNKPSSNNQNASTIASKKISLTKNISSQKKSGQRRVTTKDFWLHKLVFMNNTLPDGTEVAYYARGQRLLEGYIKGSGIFCSCCSSVISPSQFEAHAGCAQRRKPYLNIYTSNGVSLHELSVSLSKGQTFSARENDDLCRICSGDGDLLLCDSCPRSFHKECVGLVAIPKGNWYCPCCENMIQREQYVAHNENAVAAGRISGVDSIEQIFQRCIRIVQTPEADGISCVLCRCHDFSKSGFGPRTVLLCDQCEKEFHIGCLKSHNIADLEELPEGEWFCCTDCSIVYIELRKFVLSGAQPISKLHLDVIKFKESENNPVNRLDLDVRWQLLNGNLASPDTRLLLSSAVSIFQELFNPIIDLPTGQDLIPCMVYGKDIGHQDFRGMYCAVLTVNTSVVSVGLLRVLGRDVAELPLVATTKESQGQGYFQALFSCIEALLESLSVEHLVLPATKEAEEIWIKKFGFCEITKSQLEEYTKGTRPMSFQGTPMLHKPVPKPLKNSIATRRKKGRD